MHYNWTFSNKAYEHAYEFQQCKGQPTSLGNLDSTFVIVSNVHHMDPSMHYYKNMLFWLENLVKKNPIWTSVKKDHHVNLNKTIWTYPTWFIKLMIVVQGTFNIATNRHKCGHTAPPPTPPPQRIVVVFWWFKMKTPFILVIGGQGIFKIDI